MTLSASNSTQSFHQFEAAANFQMSSDSDFEEDNLSPAYGLNLKWKLQTFYLIFTCLILNIKGQLLTAITNGNLSMVKQMVEFGLNVNYIYDKEQNYSFLHLACLMGHSTVVK
jgi:hypothetical protein